MRLKKLEIQGFKSFADKTEMTFEQGITGIVGPNGCGKSNISDAVRWVLGEQSAKTLRGAKMEDVIFGGTEKRRRLSCCEVTLTFDNEDRALPIDFSEVAVTRRAYRSGESEYQINRAACRLRDVVDLFRDTGIGKEGYSLIGQGRIDEILSAKSDDRRQIFEEAAGIVKYKARKNEAERRIENTRLNLSRVEDILGELEARVEPLRLQSETAREYMTLREELKKLELNVFLARGERYQTRITELNGALREIGEAIDEGERQHGELTAARETAQERLSSEEARSAEARETVQELIRDVEAKDGAAQVLRERISACARDCERLRADLNAARQGEGGVEKQLGLLSERIKAESADARQAKADCERDETALSLREKELSELESEQEKKKTALIDAMNRLSDVKSGLSRLGAMRDALTARLASLEDDRTAGADEADAGREQVRAAEERLNEERASKRELDEMAADAAERVRALGERSEEIAEEIAALSAKRTDVTSRLRVLEDMQRDYEGFQFSVKNVLQQAAREGRSGVRGVVATLIRVPKEFERAIDMVLGAALQNIVVDREEDAKRMIDYLRGNRMGRATFLPISAVRGRTLDAQERRVLSMPGCVGVATELIDFDPVYRGVVESLLGRTVVAKDLDSGIQIMRAGRHAFRLVTLEGDVMHSGGSMTGGSVQSRGTNILSREREIAEHREALNVAGAAYEKARAEQTALDGERAALKRERAELFDRVHQQEIACAREEAHLSAARDELNARIERAGRFEDARGQLTQQLADVAGELAAIEGRQDAEEGDGDALREAIARAQKALVELRARVSALREAASERRVRLAAQERGLDAMIADRDRLASQRQDLGKLLRESGEQLALREGEEADSRARLLTEERALDEAKRALDEARGAFEAFEAERAATQKALRDLNGRIDALRAENEAATERKHRAEMQLSRVEADLQQMTTRVWEDYELSREGAEPFREADFKLTDAEKRIAQIRSRIREMGTVNVAAVDEYRQVTERVAELGAQRDDLVKAELDLSGIIEELLRKMETQFRAQFDLLNAFFQKTFVQLFGGGQATLKLADPKDALNCGIEIVAQPPGKKLQLLSLLSGGERALTAIAILFAMLKLKPTPFCFLDEIEAALDDANIDNFATYLNDYSHSTQFVVVTHRKGTMEKCDALYGVAMEEKGVSKMVSVKMGDAKHIA